MSGSSFGNIFKITTFGESHGAALGVVIDGVPAGLPISLEFIQSELDRRRPGQSSLTTARKEGDQAEILSGVLNGIATGTPLAILIRNTDQRSKDYSKLEHTFRPGHADYTYTAKYGIRDVRGGGRSSGRETAARVAAGAVATLFLQTLGVNITAFAKELAGVKAEKFDAAEIEKNPARCPDADAAKAMIEAVAEAAAQKDSVGGIVGCRISGVPAGWGEPVFDKLDALLAHAMLSLGAVKGIEFGAGFASAAMRGSENNDALQPGATPFVTNNAGGILGGISNGDEITFQLAVKPTPSISQVQSTIDDSGNACTMEITGRHDPCIVPRIIPVVEAMAALVLADCALAQRTTRLD
ncbi:MAG: chorismate synthase [Lentisphaeria bacterium]|nr:chorismate synthase [Lentisphaeria bacterium]